MEAVGLRSVVKVADKEEYHVISNLSESEAEDEIDETEERNWRKRQNDTTKRMEYSQSPKEKRSKKSSHGYNKENRHRYRDLDKPDSEDDIEDIDFRSQKRDREKEDREKIDKYRREKRKADKSSGDEGKSLEEKLTEVKASKKKKDVDDILTRTGGAYIPPSRLRQLQEGITDKSSTAYQRMAWEALKKSINGLVNKVNISNMENIVAELLEENIVRGRGLFAQSVIRAQVASPTFSNVYAALVAVINTKFPKIGELILRRCIIQFKRSFKRNDKRVCINSAKFIAHLVNQEVAHELLALELLTLLLQNPTGDSVEVAVSFLKDIGQKLTEVSPRGANAVFERLRNILHDSQTEKRVQYMIEVVFAIRKDGFKDYPTVGEGLDKVEEDDQITHLLRLDDTATGEDILNVFKHDPDYMENEEKYKQIKQSILGDDEGDSSGSDDDDDDSDDENDEEGADEEATGMDIIDKTETNLVALRRLIYLTVQSSLDYEECAHKMLKINLKPGQEHEFCLMVVECCAQLRSYEKFFGLLGQRFCLLRKEFMEQYVVIFKEQYDSCHHLQTNKLRNTAKFFSHLLFSDAIPWTVLEGIRLNEDDTTSSSRIFIKIVFQELAEYLGLQKLKTRLKDPIIAPYLEGIFPRDNPRDTRFAINFFTAVGLGGLTDELREHLKTMPKVNILAQKLAAVAESEASSSDSSSSSSSDSSDSSSSSESSSEDEDNKHIHKKRGTKKRNISPNERKTRRRTISGSDGELTYKRNSSRSRRQRSVSSDVETRREKRRSRSIDNTYSRRDDRKKDNLRNRERDLHYNTDQKSRTQKNDKHSKNYNDSDKDYSRQNRRRSSRERSERRSSTKRR